MSNYRELRWTIETEADKRAKMYQAWEMVNKGLPSGPVEIIVTRPRRNTRQNALLWALLNEVSWKVEWYGQKLSPEDWKNVCTASLTKQKAVPGIDGGVVMIGRSTSKMTKGEFSELLEVLYAFGADKGVTFSDRVSAEYGEWLESINA